MGGWKVGRVEYWDQGRVNMGTGSYTHLILLHSDAVSNEWGEKKRAGERGRGGKNEGVKRREVRRTGDECGGW